MKGRTMKILHIEYILATAEDVRFALYGHTVEHADTGEYGIDLVTLYEYDCVICGTDLPDMAGFDLVKRIRDAKIEVPVMVLSSRGDAAYKVQTLHLGADDYLTKPFDSEELAARVSALVRRSRGFARSVIEVDGLQIDLDRKTASWLGTPISFTISEYKMVELMALRRGTPVTKDMFLSALYSDADSEPDSRIIDVFLCYLRRKLAEASGRNDVVRTLWGRGYVMGDAASAA